VEKKDTYLTLGSSSEGFYKEKGSKFYAFAYRIKSEEEVKKKLVWLRKKYFDARHHCYAFILGIHGENFRANDDGEPGHSAGDPILGQIRSNGLTNTLIVVVRYFGGTKLGVGGLINAYKAAAANAIENNKIVINPILKNIFLEFEYSELNYVMKLVKDYDLEILDQKMQMLCAMTVGVRLSKEASIRSRLKEFHKIRVIPKS